jgi:hypothetical protein
MTELERIIPKLNKTPASRLIHYLDDPENFVELKTEEQYVEKIKQFEIMLENKIIQLFYQLRLEASTKSDRYSLPYQKEFSFKQAWKGNLETKIVVRKFLKEILNQNIYKIRFYAFINMSNDGDFYGTVDYRIRYYIH